MRICRLGERGCLDRNSCQRGLGSVEYLVIFAIVLLVALLVANLLGMGLWSGTKNQISASRTYWNSQASPVKIMDWSMRVLRSPTGNGAAANLTLVLLNPSREPLTITGIHVSPGNFTIVYSNQTWIGTADNLSLRIEAGGQKMIIVQQWDARASAYLPPQTYSLDINFTYSGGVSLSAPPSVELYPLTAAAMVGVAQTGHVPLVGETEYVEGELGGECPSGMATCGGICVPADRSCGGGCCLPPNTGCNSAGGCCGPGQPVCGGACCTGGQHCQAGSCVTSTCTAPDVPCGTFCCPAGKLCADASSTDYNTACADACPNGWTVPCGDTCCGYGEYCADAGTSTCAACAAGAACGTFCCPDGVVTDTRCNASSTPLACTNCCSPGTYGCGEGYCCGDAQRCVQGGALAADKWCVNSSCALGQKACYNPSTGVENCCSSGQYCDGNTYECVDTCDPARTCGNFCCDPNNPLTAYCFNNACVASAPAPGDVCGDGTFPCALESNACYSLDGTNSTCCAVGLDCANYTGACCTPAQVCDVQVQVNGTTMTGGICCATGLHCAADPLNLSSTGCCQHLGMDYLLEKGVGWSASETIVLYSSGALCCDNSSSNPTIACLVNGTNSSCCALSSSCFIGTPAQQANMEWACCAGGTDCLRTADESTWSNPPVEADWDNVQYLCCPSAQLCNVPSKQGAPPYGCCFNADDLCIGSGAAQDCCLAAEQYTMQNGSKSCCPTGQVAKDVSPAYQECCDPASVLVDTAMPPLKACCPQEQLTCTSSLPLGGCPQPQCMKQLQLPGNNWGCGMAEDLLCTDCVLSCGGNCPAGQTDCGGVCCTDGTVPPAINQCVPPAPPEGGLGNVCCDAANVCAGECCPTERTITVGGVCATCCDAGEEKYLAFDGTWQCCDGVKRNVYSDIQGTHSLCCTAGQIGCGNDVSATCCTTGWCDTGANPDVCCANGPYCAGTGANICCELGETCNTYGTGLTGCCPPANLTIVTYPVRTGNTCCLSANTANRELYERDSQSGQPIHEGKVCCDTYGPTAACANSNNCCGSGMHCNAGGDCVLN